MSEMQDAIAFIVEHIYLFPYCKMGSEGLHPVKLNKTFNNTKLLLYLKTHWKVNCFL